MYQNSLMRLKEPGRRVVGYRRSKHLKGEKLLLNVCYGDPILAGIILGKDTLLLIKDYLWIDWIKKSC